MTARISTAAAARSTGNANLDYAAVTLLDEFWPWPREWPTEQMVIEAILYAVYARGLAALHEPATRQRLARLNHLAHEEIAERVAGMLARGEIDAD